MGRRKRGFDKNGHRHCKGCDIWKPLIKFQVFGISKVTGNKLRYKQCISCRAKSHHNVEKRRKFYDKAKIRRLNLKSKIVKMLGGKCNSCGGIFPDCVYDLHHTDPNKKDSLISRLIPCFSKEKELFKEVKKCKLLCSNCHRILHYGGGYDC